MQSCFQAGFSGLCYPSPRCRPPARAGDLRSAAGPPSTVGLWRFTPVRASTFPVNRPVFCDSIPNMLDANKFAHISVKIGRAKKQFSDLQSEILGWQRSKPCVIRAKRDPQTRQLIYYVHSAKSLPLEIPALIGDVLRNLRSSLDYIVYQFFEIRRSTTPPTQRFFPVCDSAKNYEDQFTKIQKNLGHDVPALIPAAKPYKRLDELFEPFPNGALWCLHSLNNVSKHRLPLTV